MTQENRQAVRLACDLPIRLEGASGVLDATLLDVSRTGLRLRIAGDLLGVHRLSSLEQIKRGLSLTARGFAKDWPICNAMAASGTLVRPADASDHTTDLEGANRRFLAGVFERAQAGGEVPMQPPPAVLAQLLGAMTGVIFIYWSTGDEPPFDLDAAWERAVDFFFAGLRGL